MVRFLFISCVIVIIGVCACTRTDPMQQPGIIELSDVFVAEFDLVDYNGQTAPDERFEGKPMLIYFGFASCPDVCPAALSVMSATIEGLGQDAKKIQPLFVTIDPERDTPAVLKAHLAFDDRILGLTGAPDQIDIAVSNMKGYAKKVPMPDSALGYSMDHLDLFYYVDASGTPLYAFRGGMSPDAIAYALKSLIN